MNLCVIICTKNRPVELEATLKSIFFQTILPDKIVIVDDGNYVDTERVLINSLGSLLPITITKGREQD